MHAERPSGIPGGFMFHVNFDHLSVVGHVRDNNEDSFAVIHGNENSGNLAVLCDGMGGAAGGEIASRIACETFYDYPTYRVGIKPFSAGSNRKRLERMIHMANIKVRDFTRTHPRYKGMGTTVSALLILEDKIVIAHVGDSRIYRLREGKMTCLTEDQTLRHYLLSTGRISPAEAVGHPSGHVLMQAVGPTPRLRRIHSLVDELAAGDVFLMCSDGLSDLVPDPEIEAAILTQPIEQICRELVDMALQRGGTDNVTVITAHVQNAVGQRRAA
jgi:protein phosphatase